MPSGPGKSCTLKPNTMLFESVKMKNTAERNEWGFTKESNDRKSRPLLKKPIQTSGHEKSVWVRFTVYSVTT